MPLALTNTLPATPVLVEEEILLLLLTSSVCKRKLILAGLLAPPASVSAEIWALFSVTLLALISTLPAVPMPLLLTATDANPDASPARPRVGVLRLTEPAVPPFPALAAMELFPVKLMFGLTPCVTSILILPAVPEFVEAEISLLRSAVLPLTVRLFKSFSVMPEVGVPPLSVEVEI